MAVPAIPRSHTTQGESQTRIDLAACYRLVDLFGWSDLINTRITGRVPGHHDHFLINPYGLQFEEVTFRPISRPTRACAREAETIAPAHSARTAATGPDYGSAGKTAPTLCGSGPPPAN